MKRELEIRHRNEQLIRFWAQYVLMLMLGFIGVAFLIGPRHRLQLGFAILSSLIVTFICFAWYMFYHKQTSDMMRKVNK